MGDVTNITAVLLGISLCAYLFAYAQQRRTSNRRLHVEMMGLIGMGNNPMVGDTVDILVQAKNPDKISGLNPTKGGVIFIVLGILVAIAGCVSSVRLFIKKR